jgi:hypothetical protein
MCGFEAPLLVRAREPLSVANVLPTPAANRRNQTQNADCGKPPSGLSPQPDTTTRNQTQKTCWNLKTGVRKDTWVRIPPPPLRLMRGSAGAGVLAGWSAVAASCQRRHAVGPPLPQRDDPPT